MTVYIIISHSALGCIAAIVIMFTPSTISELIFGAIFHSISSIVFLISFIYSSHHKHFSRTFHSFYLLKQWVQALLRHQYSTNYYQESNTDFLSYGTSHRSEL